MKMNRIMLAAPKSGSGKTTITCAVLQLLKDRRVPVSSYKCGPDYIDPMFHQKVLGVLGEESGYLLYKTRKPPENSSSQIEKKATLLCWRV